MSKDRNAHLSRSPTSPHLAVPCARGLCSPTIAHFGGPLPCRRGRAAHQEHPRPAAGRPRVGTAAIRPEVRPPQHGSDGRVKLDRVPQKRARDASAVPVLVLEEAPAAEEPSAVRARSSPMLEELASARLIVRPLLEQSRAKEHVRRDLGGRAEATEAELVRSPRMPKPLLVNVDASRVDEVRRWERLHGTSSSVASRQPRTHREGGARRRDEGAHDKPAYGAAWVSRSRRLPRPAGDHGQ